MYNPRDIIDVIAANVRMTRNPFGIPKFLLNQWHKNLQIPRTGDAMLFTGLMYQFVPYIETSTDYLAKFEDSEWAQYLRYARYVPGYLSGLGLSLITHGTEKKKYDAILQAIARILTASRVSFFYRPELDDYSGVLLYDLGDQQEFVRHARYVAQKLKKNGIRKLITVDPHTTYALKVLFPKYADESFDVTPYFELLNLHSHNGTRRVTLHDPCFYGRYLEVSDAPRRVLSGMGIECVNVRDSGLFTSCCGGPAESISPKLSGSIVKKRVADLEQTGEQIVAMCPICLGNLRKAGAKVKDLATVIADGLDG
ncbi:MAG: (Fe-S)-binding protein [Desulfococcaceae bacterium]